MSVKCHVWDHFSGGGDVRAAGIQFELPLVDDKCHAFTCISHPEFMCWPKLKYFQDTRFWIRGCPKTLLSEENSEGENIATQKRKNQSSLGSTGIR